LINNIERALKKLKYTRRATLSMRKRKIEEVICFIETYYFYFKGGDYEIGFIIRANQNG